MKADVWNLKTGDFIIAKRPPYNQSGEVFVESKKIRPFVVLATYNETFLAVACTTNKNNIYNFGLDDLSSARTNDLYVIPYEDVKRRYIEQKLEGEKLEQLLQMIYKQAKNNNILYDSDIKKLFIDFINIHNRDLRNQKLKEKQRIFQPCDVIYDENMPNKRYIIDEIGDEHYLTHPIEVINGKYEINYAKTINLEKNDIYWLLFKFNPLEFQKGKDDFIKNKYNYKSKFVENSDLPINVNIGDIVEYNKQKYFVICLDKHEKNIVCINYGGNYMLDNIVEIHKKNCKLSKMQLSNDEKIIILRKILMNIDILKNEYVQNAISLKIKSL